MPAFRLVALAGLLALLAMARAAAAAGAPADPPDLDRERRCLALIAYAEAAGEGPKGMLAVMKVVKNRIRHPLFADDACAVALEPGQFQPVGERPALRAALKDPRKRSLAEVLQATSREARLTLVEAWRIAGALGSWPERDPTGGALYFVNPRFMDPRKCAWFAGLKRTARIGAHVFMTHYGTGERRGRPALDCATAGRGFGKGVRLARGQATGLFDPEGPKVATRTPTPRQLQAWRRTGELARRQAELKRHFEEGWNATGE